MTIPGLENIHVQTDTVFIQELNLVTNKLQDDIRLNINSDVIQKRTSSKEIDKIKKNIKDSMIRNELDKISSILSKRFGFNITVENRSLEDFQLSNIRMPNLNSRTLNVAMKNIDALFPNKSLKGMMWEQLASKNELAVYNTLTAIKESIKRETFNMDFKKAKVSGLNNENFIINVDVVNTVYLNMTSEEVTSILLFEVGRIFAYLEYMYTTTNNSFTLLDTFINNKYEKQKDPIESLSIAIDKETGISNPSNRNTIGVLQELDMYLLRTFNFDVKRHSITIEYRRTADIFVTRFNMGDILATALAKRATSGLVEFNNNDEYQAFGTRFINTVMNGLMVFLLAILFVIFITIGMLIILMFVIIGTIVHIIKFIVKSIVDSFAKLLFNDGYKIKNFDDVITRLKKIKLEVIREIRTLQLSKEESKRLIEETDSITKTLDTLSNVTGKLNKYGFIPNDVDEIDTNDLIEQLTENEMHLYGAKLKSLN